MSSNDPRMDSKPSRSRARRLLRDWRFWAGAVVALYTIAGFLIVPLVAKSQITSQTRKLLQCEAHVAKARFNPYTFNTTLGGFVLQDRQGDTLATFGELYVNLAPWALRKKTVVLEEVRLTSPSMSHR